MEIRQVLVHMLEGLVAVAVRVRTACRRSIVWMDVVHVVMPMRMEVMGRPVEVRMRMAPAEHESNGADENRHRRKLQP